MKNFKTLLTVTAGACALASSATAMIEIDTSYVGDIGNANDSTGYGGVSYDYHVGTYEVTNSQYVSFLNAKGSTNAHGVFNGNMESQSYGGIQQDGTGVGGDLFTYSVKSGMGNKAVNYVSFWDAARFTNWLTNGQGSGDTESGMYNLGGVTHPTNGSVTRQLDFSAGQNGVAVASEDEWYKAAYYQPVGAGGDTDSYWLYPTASNATPSNDLVGIDPGNNANCYQAGYTVGAPTYLTDVGEFENSASYYGTFDQGGNVREWNDAIVSSGSRGLRGGAFNNDDPSLQSSNRSNGNPSVEFFAIGFRVSSLAPIPEPSTYAAIFGCLALTVATMRRNGRRTL